MTARRLSAVLLVLALGAAPAAAQQWQPGGPINAGDKPRDELKKDLEKAKDGDPEGVKKLVAALSHKHQLVRGDAWKHLCNLENEKAVDLVIKAVEKEPNPDTRADLIEVFEETRQKKAIPALLKLLPKDDKNRQLIAWVLGELGAKEAVDALSAVAKKDKDPRAQAEAIEALAKLDPAACVTYAEPGLTHDDYEVRVGSLRALAAVNEEKMLAGAVANLKERKSNLEKKKRDRWQPALMAIRGVLHAREKAKHIDKMREAIDALVTLLPAEKSEGEKGRMKHEVAQALRTLCNKPDMEDDGTIWKEWWDVNRERYAPADAPGANPEGEKKGGKKKGEKGEEAPPANGGGEPAPEERAGTTVRFHGIPIWSDRVVFVNDCSGSMTGEIPDANKKPRPKMELTREELARTVKSLPDDIMFNLGWFGSSCTLWQKSLVESNKQSRATGADWAGKLAVPGKETSDARTNYYAALTKPLEDPQVDTVYVLIDGGIATDGRYVDHDRIIRRFWDHDKYALAEVNCLIFGAKEDTAGGARRWLEKLCRMTGGSFYTRP